MSPKTQDTLADRAMLVRLAIRRWSARRKDKAVTAEVAANHGASEDAGTYSKLLIAREALKGITQLACEIRHWHYDNTLPWHDNGARVLPAEHFEPYSKQLRKYTTQWHAVVAAFVGAYPDWVQNGAARLNTMFDLTEYPKPAEIGDRFALDVEIDPIPTGDDWRLDLGTMHSAKIRRQIQQRLKAAQAEAMSSLWDRLHDVVTKIADKLGNPEGIFRDSLIGNAQKLCGLLTTLNVAEDPKLEKMRQTVEQQLAAREPAALRGDSDERKAAAKKAAEIAGAMAGLMGSGKKAPKKAAKKGAKKR